MQIPGSSGLREQAANDFQIRSCRRRIRYILISIHNATVGDGPVAAGITKSGIIQVKGPFKREYATALIADLTREVERLDKLEGKRK